MASQPRGTLRPERVGSRRATLRGSTILTLFAALSMCSCCSSGEPDDEPSTAKAAAPSVDRTEERRAMIEHLQAVYGFREPRVLAALERVPRHRFVPSEHQRRAYGDHPLPIGHAQTISQPFIVASMTAAAGIDSDDRVLEIGTGSGYQAAVLAELVDRVYSIEIVRPLGERAAAVLAELGYRNVHLRIGDGYQGWPQAAPFDAILLTAAPDHVPAPLQEQLAVGGRLVLPVGDWSQELIVITRTPTGFERERLMAVRFVPMTGEARSRSR